MSNDSIDKLAEQYASTEDDAKAYQKAQASTIISQTKEINILRKQREQLEAQIAQLIMENTQFKALNPTTTFDISDEETICVVQIALLKNLAMQRELTLEECKKTEIYCKVLKDIRSKVLPRDEDKIDGLTNDQLLELMKSAGEA
jgi:hypothetical protein